MQSRIAVILLNWNSYNYSKDCLISLSNSIGEKFDIIVVDNGSTDESALKLKNEFPRIILLMQSSNLGFAEGNNKGFNYALKNGYEYVMMLNNDVFVDPYFIQYLINYMDFHPETGAIQPKIFFSENRSKLWNGGSKYIPFFGWTYSENNKKYNNRFHNKIREVDWITGCAFFIRARILNEIGLLNQNYFIYYEDVDLSFRIRRAGYKLIFHPDSVIYHIAGVTSKSKKRGSEGYLTPFVHYLNFRNHLWFLRTWTSWFQWPTVLFTYLTYTTFALFYFILRFRFKKFRAVLNGVYDGFAKSYSI